MLAKLLSQDPAVASAVDEVVAHLNADPDLLHEFLEQQNYRVAYWRMASRDLGYRRFFDINSLVGLRIEHERVFEATHKLVRNWVAEGRLTGLRVDHPDGLRDPLEYFQRLRAACPNTWIVAEKIFLALRACVSRGRSRAPPVTTFSTWRGGSSSIRPVRSL